MNGSNLYRLAAAVFVFCLLLASCKGQEKVPIVTDGISDYVIVIPESPTEEEKDCASLFKRIICEATGADLKIRGDWLDKDTIPPEKEIIIGNADREQSKIFSEALLPGEGGWAEIEGRLVLCSNGDGLLGEAVRSFLIEKLGYDGTKDETAKKTVEFYIISEEKKIITMKMQNTYTPLPDSAFAEKNDKKLLFSGDYALLFEKADSGYSVAVTEKNGEKPLFKTEFPATVRVLTSVQTRDNKEFGAGYANIIRTDSGYIAIADIATDNGSRFRVTDDWYIHAEGSFALDRTVTVVENGKGDKGFASLISFVEISGDASCESYDYFIPAVLYRNTEYMTGLSVMNDLSEKRSYVKETRTGTPLAMLRNKKTGNTLTLQHLKPEISNRDNLYRQVCSVNDGVQYGAIGYSFDSGAAVDYIYPCSEGPYNYEFGTEKEMKQWVYRYHPVSREFSHSYTLSLIPDDAETYQDAMINSYRAAYAAASPYIAEVDIDKVYKQIIEVYEGLYEEYRTSDGSYVAGIPFMVDVRGEIKNIKYNWFVNGFTGAQSDVGYEMYREGVLSGNSELAERGKKILDFWSSSKTNANALPTVFWQPEKNGTGGYDNGHPPMLRYIIDGADGLLKAYIFSKEQGKEEKQWLAAVEKLALYLVRNQNSDGSFWRTYNAYGGVIDSDWHPNFAGHSKVNTPVAIRYLARMYLVTGDERYKAAALNAADYAYNELYLGLGKYVGGTPDNPNVTDKEAAIYAMYGFDAAYELTGEQKYYDAYLHALYSAMSWVMTYDYVVTVPVSNAASEVMMFGDGFTSGFSFIATGHSGIDVYGASIYYDLFRQYIRTGDELYLSFAGMLQNNARRSTDMNGERGYLYPGFSSEACIAAEFVYYASEDGIYVPWIGVAFADPMISMYDHFGTADIYEATERYSLNELREITEIRAYE